MSPPLLKIRRPSFLVVSLLVLIASVHLRAQESEEAPATEDPAHAELRTLRTEIVDAFKKKNIDRLLACMHKDVVVTLQNAEVCEGHQEVKDFHERMSEGENRSVQSQETTFQVDDLSILYGEDTAIARGSIQDGFKLTAGMDFQLSSRWTATLVKEEGRWLVASFHASTNMFDNGVSDLMLKWNSIKVGGMALLAGIVASVAVVKVGKRRS